MGRLFLDACRSAVEAQLASKNTKQNRLVAITARIRRKCCHYRTERRRSLQPAAIN
jgi:hypothetical protein